MKTKLFYLAMTIAVVLSACKGEEGPEGPQGPAGSNGTPFSFAQGGSIQGTINGFQSNGTPFNNMTFDYKYYYDQDMFTYQSWNLQYRFQFYRYPSSNPIVPGYCYMYFYLYPLTSTLPTGFSLSGEFLKDLGNNQKFSFQINGLSNSNTIITAFSYNAATRVASGTFAINVDSWDNSTGYPATISGTFQSNPLVEYVFRKE